jgi:hypothetical protein
VLRGVEHERDAGELLNGPIVEEERDAPTLVLLGRDQPLDARLRASSAVGLDALLVVSMTAVAHDRRH